ncbi:MAG: hypothetical protein JW987_12240 [Anaerolineaceae bacterium]|nr:hypothetical protein [Anaerolineaceae bacterium]
MFLSPAEIDACTAWLLENASPPVRYLTHVHILKTDPGSEAARALWRAVETCADAQMIFSLQNEDGSWFSGGPWGPRGYRQQTGSGYTTTRPKFVTTAWILPYLGEMGFTAADPRVRKSCELILNEAGYQQQARDPDRREVNCCGLAAIPLRALASVGMAPDERLRTGWDQLALCQRSDGGWLNPRHLADSPNPSQTQGRWPWDRSCAWGSFFAVQALYYARDPRLADALRAALDFMRGHLEQKDPADIQTWVYHGHNTVKELLMFSEAGLDLSAPPIPALLEWLKGHYRPAEGMFRAQERPIPEFTRQVAAIIKDYAARRGAGYWETISRTSPPVLRYHLYHLAEDDWLTYSATRIGLNLNAAA